MYSHFVGFVPELVVDHGQAVISRTASSCVVMLAVFAAMVETDPGDSNVRSCQETLRSDAPCTAAMRGSPAKWGKVLVLKSILSACLGFVTYGASGRNSDGSISQPFTPRFRRREIPDKISRFLRKLSVGMPLFDEIGERLL